MICVHQILFELKITCKSNFSNVSIFKRWYIFLATMITNSAFCHLSVLCRYENPILDIKWHRTLNSAQPKLITTDNRIVRIWNPETVIIGIPKTH